MISLKKTALAMVMILTLAALTGCVVVGWGPGGFRGTVRGEGTMTSAEHEVGAYDAVDISGVMKVVYSASPSTKVKLDIQENLRQYVTFRVENGVLTVDSDRSFSIRSFDETPVLYLYNPNLKAVYASGGITMNASEPIKVDSFVLELSGAGDVDLNLDVKSIYTSLSGAANLNLRGKAEEASMEISGAGEIDALELFTQRARINISGAGSASISCSDDLNVSLSGVGSLKYRGSPSLKQNVSGVGSVTQVG